MLHFESAVILRDWPGRCPCGAAATHAYGLCAKCQARAYWRRRKSPTRGPAARRAKRLARRRRRLLPVPRIARPAIARTTNRSR